MNVLTGMKQLPGGKKNHSSVGWPQGDNRDLNIDVNIDIKFESKSLILTSVLISVSGIAL